MSKQQFAELTENVQRSLKTTSSPTKQNKNQLMDFVFEMAKFHYVITFEQNHKTENSILSCFVQSIGISSMKLY